MKFSVLVVWLVYNQHRVGDCEPQSRSYLNSQNSLYSGEPQELWPSMNRGNNWHTQNRQNHYFDEPFNPVKVLEWPDLEDLETQFNLREQNSDRYSRPFTKLKTKPIQKMNNIPKPSQQNMVHRPIQVRIKYPLQIQQKKFKVPIEETNVQKPIQQINVVPKLIQQVNNVPKPSQKIKSVQKPIQQINNLPKPIQQIKNAPKPIQQINKLPKQIQQRNNVPKQKQQVINKPKLDIPFTFKTTVEKPLVNEMGTTISTKRQIVTKPMKNIPNNSNEQTPTTEMVERYKNGTERVTNSPEKRAKIRKALEAMFRGDPMTAKKKNPAAIWFSTMLIKMLKKKPKKKKFKSQFGKEAFFDGENNKDEDKPPPN